MVNNYYVKNKEKILQKRKEYREKNKEKVKECKRLSRLKHLEENKQRDKEHYQKNSDKIKKRAKNYYQENKNKILQQHKENRKELSSKAIKEYHKNPERRKKTIMRAALNKEFQRGNAKKEKCEVCGTTESLEFHHEDYNDPKKIKVLCKKHHLEAHNKQKETKMENIFS